MSDSPMLLVIGYGNSLRRDDGAGLILAEMLTTEWEAKGRPVRLLLAHQLGPEMALDIAMSDVAVVLFIDTFIDTIDTFIDTAVEAPPLVAMEPIYPAAERNSLTHQLSPQTLLLYAARLFDHHPRGWMMRIRGEDFDHGDKLSASVAETVSRAVYDAERWWNMLWTNGAAPR